MFLGTLLLLLSGTARAQHLSHQVLVPAAGITVSATVNLTQSIGENAVILMSSDNNDLTQGFQQPRIKTILDGLETGTVVKVFPVPATDILYVELHGQTAIKYKISLIDISGRLVYSTDLDFDDRYAYRHTIPVNGFVRGLYFVVIKCSKGKIDRTFKISII
jgi:hypothetical protein